MIALDAATVSQLPVDQLGIEILKDLIATDEWNEHNYLIRAGEAFRGEPLDAIAEAMAWLRARALIARTPGQSAADAIMVTRTGEARRKRGADPVPRYCPPSRIDRVQMAINPW